MERFLEWASAAFAVAMLAASWKIFTKAGHAGWKCLIPIYGAVVFMRIVGRPGWWVLLMIIPVVNLFLSLALCIDLARAFGKGGAYAAGLAFLTPIFLLMLAYGDAEYQRGQRPRRISPELARLYPDRVDRAA